MKRADRLARDGDPEPILFYSPNDPYGEFSNFSSHTVTAVDPWTKKMRTYQTGEHMYQALKADNQREHDIVASAHSPGLAKSRGRTVSLRAGWGNDIGDLCWYVMLDVVMRKATQHSNIMNFLGSTLGHHIYEDSPVDDIWGWRYESNYSGKNLLGLCWMDARYFLFEA